MNSTSSCSQINRNKTQNNNPTVGYFWIFCHPTYLDQQHRDQHSVSSKLKYFSKQVEKVYEFREMELKSSKLFWSNFLESNYV